MNLKTILGWAAVAFAVWWIVEQPTDAAHLVHSIGVFLSSMASGMSHFVACMGGCPSGRKQQATDWAVFGIVIGGFAALLLLITVVLWLQGKRRDSRVDTRSRN